MNERIAERIRLYPDEGLPCPVAHYIAAELGVSPVEVGRAADDMNIRCTMCQLGLFGYAVKGRPAYRVRQPMESVPEELEQAIQSASREGRVSCADLWQIGRALSFSRLEMGNAVEGLGIKVKPCQLGFF
jgi:hypothetical protein